MALLGQVRGHPTPRGLCFLLLVLVDLGKPWQPHTGVLLDFHTAPGWRPQRTPDFGPTSNRKFKGKGWEQKRVDTLLSMNKSLATLTTVLEQKVRRSILIG